MERSSDLELLQQEVNGMGGVASRIDVGITALHRARLEEEEAERKKYAQTRNADGTFALDGAIDPDKKRSVSGIGEMLSVRLNDWDQEDGLNPLVHTLMNGLYDVNVTNALSDIVEPLSDTMRDNMHNLILKLERFHKEDMMWQAMQLTAFKGGANKNAGSPFQRMYLLWNNFMRQPFWNSVNLLMRGFKTMISPITSAFNHVFFGQRDKQTDTDRIVTAIDKQTQLIRNGIIIDRMPYEDLHKYGLIGGSLKWLGETALAGATFGKVSRKNAQRIEDDRATNNRSLSSFEDFLINRVFTVNRRQTNLDAGKADPNASIIEVISGQTEVSRSIDTNALEATGYLRSIDATVADIKMLMSPSPSVSGNAETASSSQRRPEIQELIRRTNREASNDSFSSEEVSSVARRTDTSVVDMTNFRRRQEEEHNNITRNNLAESTRVQLTAGSDVVPVEVVGSGGSATPSMSNTTAAPFSNPPTSGGGSVTPVHSQGASGSLTPTSVISSRPEEKNSTRNRHETVRNAFARKHNVESLDTQIDLQTAANDEQEEGNKLSKKMLRVLEKLHGIAAFQSFLNIGRVVGSVISGAFDKLSKLMTAIGGLIGAKKITDALGKGNKNVGGTAGKAAGKAAGGGALGRMGSIIAAGAARGSMGGLYGIAAGVITALASDIIIGLIPESALKSANDKIAELSTSIIDMSAKFRSWLSGLFFGEEGSRNALQKGLHGLTPQGQYENQQRTQRLEQQRLTQTQIRERLRIPEGKSIGDNYVPLSTDSAEFKRNRERYYKDRNELTNQGIKGRMNEQGRWVPVNDSNGNPVRIDGTRPEMKAVNPPIENSSQSSSITGASSAVGGVAATVKEKAQQVANGGRSMFDRLMEKMTIAESGGKQHNADGSVVKSHVGATGVLQIMPKTGPDAAKMAGLPWDKYRFEHDIDYNRALGIAYMQNLMKRYSGDAVLSTAAYNWGMGNVDKLIAKVGDPRTNMVSHGEWIRHLPSETYNYVKKTAIAANTEAREGIGNAKNYLASVGANVATGMVGGYQTTISGAKNIASGVKDYAMTMPNRIQSGMSMVSTAAKQMKTAGSETMKNPQYAVNYGVEEAEGSAAATAGAAAAMRNSQISMVKSEPSTPSVDVGPLNAFRNPQDIARAVNNNSRITNAAREKAVTSVESNNMGSVNTQSMNDPVEKPVQVNAQDGNSGAVIKILSSIDSKLGQLASSGNVSFDEGTTLSIFGR